ncbi:hypothetical protein CLOM_g18219 [Closterium sp. NIES-68]|nr:hypothetical protein CLOM_g18219 [Closterium sp. NIES-68]
MLYPIGFNLHQPARNASARIRTPDRNLAVWSAAGLYSRPADALQAEAAISGSEPDFGSKPEVAREAELIKRTVVNEEGGSKGGGGEKSIRRGGEEELVKQEGGYEKVERSAGKTEGKSEEGGRKSRGRVECEKMGRGGGSSEEEEAVAVIAGVLMEKFGPQIVREELEEGPGNGRNEDEEEAGAEASEEVEEEDGEEDEEKAVGTLLEKEGAEEGETEASAEDSPAATSRPKRPTPLNSARATSPSSLLSLYRFFSSHLGISSPSTVASLLASHPQLLRSNSCNDLLPRVHLLLSYGISHADIVHATMKNASWLRTSLPQIQDMLEFLLARGVCRTKLGSVLLHRRGLIRSQARSTNLDILVERAGFPMDKLGVLIERRPDILCQSSKSLVTQLKHLSVYFTEACGGKVEGGSISTGHLRQRSSTQHLDNNHLARLILKFPSILSYSPHRISASLAILQSFTPPGTPSIATRVLRNAPTILSRNSETLLAKLQFFVELVGEEATGRIVRSRPDVLGRSIENLQGKMAVLTGLIGRENAVRAVAQCPLLLSSSDANLKGSFRELVREVEDLLEGRDGETSGTKTLEVSEKDDELRACDTAQEVKKSKACQLVVDLVVKCPQSILCSWERNTKHKVEYLKRDMGLSMMEVLHFPLFLSFSLDRRIRRRHLALLDIGYVVVPYKEILRMSGEGRKDSRGARVRRTEEHVWGERGVRWGTHGVCWDPLEKTASQGQ